MKDYLTINVDDLSIPEPSEVTAAVKNTAFGATIAQPPASVHTLLAVGESMDCEEPLLQMVECRICQEEDSIKNLESPCACIGSLKVHIIIHLSFFSLVPRQSIQHLLFNWSTNG
jgi:hypothetical protein